MKIAVNTRLLIKGKLEGIGWFTYETLKRITEQHPEHEFFFIFDREYDKEFVFSNNVTPIVLPPPTRHPFLWILWFEYRIPKLLKKIGADIFVSTDGYISLRTNIPQVDVIHDINFVHNPKQLPWLTSWYYNKYFIKFAKKTTHIGTVSEFSKNDIYNTYGIDKEKITVCYNGSNEKYKPISESEKQEIREKYSNGKKYFVFVGALSPRKNVDGLLRSFEIFKEKCDCDINLVIVGGELHKTDAIEKVYSKMKHKNSVIFTGRLENDKLCKVMAASECLTYIPHFEGFGIPLLEAMYAETAIICGNSTSLPEVVGDAALICSSTDYEKVAENMLRICSDEELRKTLIEKGRLQRKKFSWQQTAERLWICIEKAIKI
ncbi:MAG: glycosyltransferase family 4 protein [Bacteroidales bacterium]|nr:glycosyltransferase family 4 protein [Bacteroidales bacterium]